MKKMFGNYVANSSTKTTFAAAALIFVFSGFIPDDKITICHVPPGNPGNCHEITISRNALETHLAHGDNLFCYDEAKYEDYLKLVNEDKERVIKMFELR